jgi:sulfite exporter TauE/SafE
VARPRHFWGKLPRAVYWTVGAAIAFIGAVLARLLAEGVPGYRVPIWLAGAIMIFFGLSILSLGTKTRLDTEDENREEGQRSQRGAGEGNRTLA